jgi:hypothetical protein
MIDDFRRRQFLKRCFNKWRNFQIEENYLREMDDFAVAR